MSSTATNKGKGKVRAATCHEGTDREEGIRGGWLTSGRFTPGKDPVPIVNGAE